MSVGLDIRCLVRGSRGSALGRVPFSNFHPDYYLGKFSDCGFHRLQFIAGKLSAIEREI